MSENYGLKSQIATATNEQAILGLLTEGSNFEYASDKTRRQWERKTLLRRSQLVKKTEAKAKRKN